MKEMMSHRCRVSPKLPWKVRLFVSTMSFAVDLSRRSNFTVNRTLMNLFDFKSSASQKPVDGVKSSDIVVDTTCNLWFRLYTPTSSHGGTFPVIVFFHGGGFSFMAANSKPYDDFCRRLARELSAIIISVNYRLSPEHRCPSQYEDGLKVLKFIDEWEGLIPINANLKHCFVGGDSAGGNLAHHAAVKANEHKFHNLKLIGVIAIQPFFGGEERTESEIKLDGAPLVTMELTDWTWKAFLPQGSDRDHPAANVFGPNAVDLGDMKFPATIVFVGGFDPLQDWQKRYVEGLKKCGKEAYLVEYPNAIHSFYAYPELPESSWFIDETRDFVQKQMANM
ncbi:probable carboxylesterase 18 [Durio zibethinus]|uniref:Probable carboxylesterase 18 n=1 Tax=Durio zibethinus TaxID=66656 RepID=A0A6P5Y196_DURZI|nr:probable carboxylesterase 18 [Durio zibethinus]